MSFLVFHQTSFDANKLELYVHLEEGVEDDSLIIFFIFCDLLLVQGDYLTPHTKIIFQSICCEVIRVLSLRFVFVVGEKSQSLNILFLNPSSIA